MPSDADREDAQIIRKTFAERRARLKEDVRQLKAAAEAAEQKSKQAEQTPGG